MVASDIIDAVLALVPESWDELELQETRGQRPGLSPRQTVLARAMSKHGKVSDTDIAAAFGVTEAVVKNASNRQAMSKYSLV